jgi:hypothetical protein
VRRRLTASRGKQTGDLRVTKRLVNQERSRLTGEAVAHKFFHTQLRAPLRTDDDANIASTPGQAR